MSRSWTMMELKCKSRSTWKEGPKKKVHNVCVIYVQYFFFDARSRDELRPSFRQIQYTEVATRAFFLYLFPQPGKKWRELSGHGITEEYDWNICADIFLTSEFLHPGHEMSKHGQTEEKTEDCPWGTSFNFDAQVNVNEYYLRNERNWALSYVWQDCIHALYSSKY